ncbi:hypothetical protein [Halostella salina]|uniref:hypothetical protein n=1 Tax=Halostella salina TaxID=1547897 RepID=UPI000EF83875|nr:hypothetical protein [Halostella salina]
MVNGDDEPTAGIVAYLLLVPMLLVTVGIPTIVLGALATVALYGLQATIGLPTPTFGLLGAVGLPPGLENSPIVYGLGVGLLTALWLLSRTGMDWKGRTPTPRNRATGGSSTHARSATSHSPWAGDHRLVTGPVSDQTREVNRESASGVRYRNAQTGQDRSFRT